MKQIQYILVLSICLFAWSCDDYLDTAPDERQEVKTLKNVDELVANSYSAGSYMFIEWMSDNAVALQRNDQEEWLTENFLWKPVVSNENQDTPTYFWSNTYTAIAHANQALDAIDKVPNTDDTYKKAIKGEALVARAYNHFLLASIYCQTYDPTTASGNLGIPYITSPETDLLVKYERGTLEETFSKIEKDLIDGMALVSDDFYPGSGKYHFNKAATYAFASRFYLFKKDYENCIKYSNMVLGDGVVSPSFVRDYEKVYEGTSGMQLADQFTDPKSITNLLLVRKESYAVAYSFYGYRSDDAVMNEVYSNIWRTSDHRDSRWGYRDDKRPPKYAMRWKYTTSDTGLPYYIHPELRTEEVILNRMEAYAMTNVEGSTENLDKALADLNVMIAKCYNGSPQLTPAIITQVLEAYNTETLMYFILTERRKELFREGFRWFDIKRFNMTIDHVSLSGEKLTLKENDPRKAVQIPQGAIDKGIEANPR